MFQIGPTLSNQVIGVSRLKSHYTTSGQLTYPVQKPSWSSQGYGMPEGRSLTGPLSRGDLAYT